jgi:hypothetical protein
VLPLEVLEELVERSHPPLVLVLALQRLVHPGAEVRSTAFGDGLATGFEELRVDRGGETSPSHLFMLSASHECGIGFR